MIKKIFIILGAIGFIQLIIIACCPDPITYYNRITNLMIANYNLSSELEDSAAIAQKDFRIRLTIKEETFAQTFNPSFWLSSAYATSCEDNFVGLKSDIVDFKITCNKNILGIQAGQSIDNNKII